MLHLLLAVTLNFESTGFMLTDTYSENGLNLTPNCNLSFVPEGLGGSTYIAIDNTGCYGDGTWNRDFHGPERWLVRETDTWEITPAILWIEASGTPFSLLDFFIPQFTEFRLLSSNGGLFSPSGQGFVSFGGDEWTNLDWLVFDIGAGNGISAGLGMDRLRVNIHDATTARRAPEPGTFLLLALGAMMLRRKHA